MATYRRRRRLGQMLPRALILGLALLLYPVAASPSWLAPRVSLPLPYAGFLPQPSIFEVPLAPPSPAQPVAEEAPVEWGSGSEPTWSDNPTRLASGAAPIDGLGYSTTTNIKLAIGFLDGVVIQPGEQLSFDDTARTWDYQEDPRYLMSTATSARGVIYMRGGGVCWLSTALWRAALWAGLPTDVRENHYGLVSSLGGGYDATNTLVIRNNTDSPITVHAWIDGGQVYASLYSEQPVDRTAEVRGPYNEGRGRYVLYQDVYWDDGEVTTREFPSTYYW